MKILISSLLAITLVFGATLNFSDAASTSTAKIIQNLKNQVKQLTASNKAKDKQIAQLKSQIKSKDNLIKNNQKLNQTQRETFTKEEKYLRSENMKLGKSLYDLENHNINTLNAKINVLLREELMNKSAQYSSNPYFPDPNVKEPKLVDLTINSQIFYFPNMEKYITNQELKEKVIMLLRGYSFPNIKVNSVTIQLPTGDLVIQVSEAI